MTFDFTLIILPICVCLFEPWLHGKVTNIEGRSGRFRTDHVWRLQRLRTPVYHRIFACATTSWWVWVPKIDSAAYKSIAYSFISSCNNTQNSFLLQTGAYLGGPCVCPPLEVNFFAIMFNVKNYAKFWTFWKMHTWNVLPPPPPSYISKYVTERIDI